MSIQSAINSMLGVTESAMRFQRVTMPVAEALGAKFGEQPSAPSSMSDLRASQARASAEERAERRKIAMEHWSEEGRAREAQNFEDMLAYEEQARAKGYEIDAQNSIENRTAEIGNIKQEHKKRREYLRKPHVRNKHGVKYVNGVKQEETE